jgi:hyperosmotically inducible protein
MSKWAEESDSRQLSKVYRHYGQESAFNFVESGDGRRNKDESRDSGSSRKADQSKDRVSGQIPASRLGQLQKANKLFGTSVKNLQDEKLGKVENLLVDLPSGRVVAFIVSSGGFFGMGDELSAIPSIALRSTSDRDALQLDASKETLSKAPHFKANQWPDFTEPGYAGEVYRAYNMEPHFTTDATRGADHTARNARDRKDQTLTPFDQGNSKADRDTTAQIRKEIVAGKDMSVNAKNVKIITNNGKVTLRGPVNSAEEKRLIGEIANRIAAPANVDNQLEVKFTTSSED